ncbi:MAG TPA: hypothetical protein VL949_02760 [Geobacteraceae bacterium]|nr:hypothetical protein [Geobacteraceae bacterium]
MKSKSVRNAAYLVAIIGVLLHAYLIYFHTERHGSVYGVIVPAMNVVPYLVCIVLARVTTKPVMALCSGLLVLMVDLSIFHDYLFSTRTFRFALIEFYQIMFKTAVVVPLGCFVGSLIDKYCGRSGVKHVD